MDCGIKLKITDINKANELHTRIMRSSNAFDLKVYGFLYQLRLAISEAGSPKTAQSPKTATEAWHEMTTGFNAYALIKRLDKLEEQLAKTVNSVSELESITRAEIDSIIRRLNLVQPHLGKVHGELIDLDARVDDVEKRVNGLTIKIVNVQARLRGMPLDQGQ